MLYAIFQYILQACVALLVGLDLVLDRTIENGNLLVMITHL